MTHKKAVILFVFLGDALVAWGSLFLALYLRNKSLLPGFSGFFYTFLPVYIFWFFVIFILNLYDLNFFKKPINFLLDIIIFSFFAVFSGMAYFYFRPAFGMTPNTILLLNVIIFDVLFLCWRYVFNFIMGLRGVKEKMAIVGFNPKMQEVYSQLSKNYEIVGLFCPPYLDNQGTCQAHNQDIVSVSDIDDFRKLIEEKRASSVLLATLNDDLVRETFSGLPLKLRYISFNDLYEFITKKVPVQYLDETWFLEKISNPEGKLEQILKRSFDVVFSFIGLIIFIILFPFLVAAIKLDSGGNIFYKQKRVGKNGKIFVIYKFRTMQENSNQDKEVWREKNGGNVTRVGKILRQLHLDELPQSINILRGDISFVGPRAEWIELAKVFEKEIPFYKQRYLVKPGLIGWAQINYKASKSVEEAQEKFEYDLYYIKNHSILLDLEIFLKAARLFLM